MAKVGEALAALVQAISGYVAPGCLGAAAAYAEDVKNWPGVAVFGIGAAAVPALGARAADALSAGSKLNIALQNSLIFLVDRLIAAPPPENPLFPTIRATVFVPSIVQDEKRLVCKFRLFSGTQAEVLTPGNESFRRRELRRGEGLAGQTWQDGRARYVPAIKNLLDCKNDVAEWTHGASRLGLAPSTLGIYSQNVRSIWTFAIPAPTTDGATHDPLAVFSVDSILQNAFTVDDTQHEASVFRGANLREAIIGFIAATVLISLNPRVPITTRLGKVFKGSDGRLPRAALALQDGLPLLPTTTVAPSSNPSEVPSASGTSPSASSAPPSDTLVSSVSSAPPSNPSDVPASSVAPATTSSAPPSDQLIAAAPALPTFEAGVTAPRRDRERE